MNYTGYDSLFLGKKLRVSYPRANAALKADIALFGDKKTKYLDYQHYSILMSQSRKFPYYSVVNIDGGLFRSIKRTEVSGGSDKWIKDERAGDIQWGQKLYDAKNSPFHRGHMTKREDPQWGETEEVALEAARSTFFFTNSVPQIRELNSIQWASLERYILSRQAIKHNLRITLFTGPVLSPSDPFFVSEVEGQAVQLPMLFWKIIYFSKDGKTLSRVAFLMGQTKTMFEQKIVRPFVSPRGVAVHSEPLFMDYQDAATYQVNVALVEKLTGFSFKKAFEPYKDERPSELVIEKVEINPKDVVDVRAERLFTHGERYVGIHL